MSTTQDPDTETDKQPSEMTDDELLEYIAETDTSLAAVAKRALEDQEDESE